MIRCHVRHPGFPALGLLLAVLACGCAPLRVPEPLTARLGGNDPHDRMEFWSRVAERPVLSNDEAFHALLLYLDGTDAAADYAARTRALRGRGLLATNFDRPPDEAADRGTLAVAVTKALGIKGGLTMQLAGVTPRYAVRAMEYRNLYPPSSPNQTFSGSEWVAVLARVEDYQRGDSSDLPAPVLPGDRGKPDAAGASADDGPADDHPLMLNVLTRVSAELWWQDPAGPANGPATAPAKDKPVKLRAIITGVEGDQAEVRKSEADPWRKAAVGLTVGEAGEFRTGPKSSIRFVLPPDHVYTLDRQSSVKVAQAFYDGQKVTTDVGMQQGRLRLEVAPVVKPVPPAAAGEEPVYKIERAGIEHAATIRSPNTALAIRGTQVSHTDEPGFPPESVSLTGQAQFRNTRRQLVAFGGAAKAVIRGDQASAAQQALAAATDQPNPQVSRLDFAVRQASYALTHLSDSRGDVIVGTTAQRNVATAAGLARTLPGALQFVLQWNEKTLNDLNLVVLSPLNSAASPDFVGNPPFGIAVRAGNPDAEAERAANYPRTSRSGGRISPSHLGPAGVEFATWPKNYPPGTYRVVVYNLLDAQPPEVQTVNPVAYTVNVFLNKRLLTAQPITGSVGEFQISAPVGITVPPVAAAQRAKRR